MSNPKIEVEIAAKIDRLNADFDKVYRMSQDTAKRIDSAFGSVGGSFKSALAGMASLVSVSMFAGMIKSSVDAQDKLGDLSKTTKISIADLAGLSSAASKSGGDLDSIAQSINKLSVNMGKDPEKYKAIGVSAKEPIEALKQLANVFVSIEDPQKRAAFAAEALGKSWQGVAPLLSEGGDAIGRMVDRGKALSKVTDESAAAADALNDKMVELRAASDGVSTQFANLLVPSLTETANKMVELTDKGHPLLALLQGFAGLGKIPFDLAFGSVDMSVSGQVKDLKSSLEDLQSKRENYNPFVPWGDSLKEIDQKILVTKNQIAAFDKFGGVFDKKKVADLGSPNLRKGYSDTGVDNFINAPKAGGGKGSDGIAASILAFDISQIKSNSAEAVEAYSNAEKIMQGIHSAGLMDEKDYYESKAEFIRLNAQAEEAGLQQQLDRLRREQLTGKEKINNDRAILEIEAKLSKVRESATVSLTLNSIEQEGANKKIQQSYDDARSAAEAYLDTVDRQNSRTLSGMGMGDKFRTEQSAQNQIEDKFTVRRSQLDDDLRRKQITQEAYDTYLAIATDTFDREVVKHAKTRDAILAKEGNWVTGMNDALFNYSDEAKNVAKQMEDVFTNAFNGIEDALVEFTKTGKLDFKSMINSIMADLARASIKQNITGPLADMMKGSGGTSSGGGWLSSLLGMFGSSSTPLAGSLGAAGGLPLPSFAVGTDFVPRDMVAQIHKGEKIVPAAQNNGSAKQSSQPISITVHVNGSSSAPDVRRAAGQGAREALTALNGAGRYR